MIMVALRITYDMFIVRSPLAWVNDVIPRANKQEFETLDKNDEAFKLLVVRHPFDRLERFYVLACSFFSYLRLVSAFRDKLERCHSVLGDTDKCDLERDV